MSNQILAFGDSVVEGFLDSEGGWVERLKGAVYNRMLSDDDFWCVVRNLGVSGDTSKDLLKRISSEIKVRIVEGEKPEVIIGIGGNDSAYFKKIGNPKVPEDVFAGNIDELIRQAKKFADAIIFIAATPVDENVVYDTAYIGAFEGKYFYSNSRISKYNCIVKKACEREKILFLDVPVEFRKGNSKLLCRDGLHPNTEGHRLIFEAIKAALIKNGII